MRIRKLITTIVLAVLSANAVPEVRADESERKVRVATYNMYPGTEFSGIFLSQSPQELVAEVAEAFNDVHASNVAERVDEIADQIATDQPDVVGLQEVALWRYGYPQDPAPAEAVAYDFLQMLLDRLAARGAPYAAVSVQTNLDAELTGVFSATSALDVRYTDRVVILARTDLPTSEMKVEASASGTFSVLLPVELLGTTIYVPRGWTSTDIKHRGKTYRFINAHLESFVEIVQILQAQELAAAAASTDLPLIVAGDFNSPAPTGTAYNVLLGGGLSDGWTATNAGNAGLTWPLSDENPSVLLNPDQRIDLVFSKGAITPSSSDRLGEEPGDLTPSGFRASDHAGVAASFVLHP